MITICGLWKNTGKDGKEYFSGNIGNAKILIFPNTKKTDDKHPDFNLCIAEKTKKNVSDDNPFND